MIHFIFFITDTGICKTGGDDADNSKDGFDSFGSLKVPSYV
jgi:hypothetical protein